MPVGDYRKPDQSRQSEVSFLHISGSPFRCPSVYVRLPAKHVPFDISTRPSFYFHMKLFQESMGDYAGDPTAQAGPPSPFSRNMISVFPAKNHALATQFPCIHFTIEKMHFLYFTANYIIIPIDSQDTQDTCIPESSLRLLAPLRLLITRSQLSHLLIDLASRWIM